MATAEPGGVSAVMASTMPVITSGMGTTSAGSAAQPSRADANPA